MTKSFRRRLFYFLFLIFLISGTGLVAYSRGWRVDLANFTIQKTGGIYILTKPKEVDIQIETENKSVENKPGILRNGILIDGLLPKTYKITIKKDGYLSWQKKVEVKPELVTELKQIILIPQNLKFQPVLAQTAVVKNFWPLSGNQIVFQDDKGGLYYLDYLQNKSQKLKGTKFIAGDNGGKKIITYDNSSKNFYLNDSSDPKSVLNINLIFKNIWDRETDKSFSKVKIEDIFIHSYKADNIFLSTNQGLYIIDTKQSELIEITDKNLSGEAYIFDLSNFYFADQESLWVYNLILKSKNLLAEMPNVAKLAISNSHKYLAFLQENGDFYLIPSFELGGKPQKISGGVKEFSFSPDSNKIAFWDQKGNLNLYFPEEYYYYGGFKKEKGDVVNLAKFSDLRKMIWYSDSGHLAVQDERGIYFIEIDDRPPINKYFLADEVQNFSYDFSGEFLLLKDGAFSRFIL